MVETEWIAQTGCANLASFMSPSFGEDGFADLNSSDSVGATTKSDQLDSDCEQQNNNNSSDCADAISGANQQLNLAGVKSVAGYSAAVLNGLSKCLDSPPSGAVLYSTERSVGAQVGKPAVQLLDFAQPTPPLLSPNNHSPGSPTGANPFNGESPKSEEDSRTFECSLSIPLSINTSNTGLYKAVSTSYSGIGEHNELGYSYSNGTQHQTIHDITGHNQPRFDNQTTSFGGHFTSSESLSPLSVRCTTQATVSLVSATKCPGDLEQGYHPLQAYSNGIAPGIPSYGHQQGLTSSGQSRFLTQPGYIDRSHFTTYHHPQQHHRYHPYSPVPGSVPAPYPGNGFLQISHQTPQYYHTAGSLHHSQHHSNTGYQPDQTGYGCGVGGGSLGNPQFPPHNYCDFPDITQNNSVYGQLTHTLSNGIPYHHHHQVPMATQQQREPILSRMEAGPGGLGTSMAGGEQGLGLGYGVTLGGQGVGGAATGGYGGVPRESDGEEGRSPIKLGGLKSTSSPAEETSKPKKAKSPKKRKKKDPNEPQKPVSAYAMFFRDTQASIKSSNPSASFGEVSKIVASMWDSLEDVAKSEYKRRTEIAKKEYLQKLAAYRASLVSTGGLKRESSGSSGTDSSPRESPERFNPARLAPPYTNRSPVNHLEQQPITMQEVESRGVAMANEQQGQQQQADDSNSVKQEQLGRSGQQNNSQGDDSEPQQQSGLTTNVFYGKASQQGSGEADSRQCVRDGCNNQSVSNPQWDSEYCSSQCVVDHCRDVFTAWVASRSGYTSVN